MRQIPAALLGVFLCSLVASADTGFLDRSVVVAGETSRYQVYVPLKWTPAERWPVLVWLHGSGAPQGSDGLKHIPLLSVMTAVRADRDRFPAIMIFPQARVGTRWSTPAMQQMVLAQLDSTIKEFNGDADRVYLSGFSMGGSGAVRIALRWPERFAALIDVAGWITVDTGWTPVLIEEDKRTHPFVSAADPYKEAARLIQGIPTWIFHGDADKLVPPNESRRLVAELKALGIDVRYTEYPGVDHAQVAIKAWEEKGLAEWLLVQRRSSQGR